LQPSEPGACSDHEHKHQQSQAILLRSLQDTRRARQDMS
jgi:hypothetical protein